MFEFGSIVLVPFPFTNLTSAKLRPALVISSNLKAKDVVVAFISSQQKIKSGVLVTSDMKEFSKSGLKVDSLIRFDKLATLNKKIILGQLGILPIKFLRDNKKAFESVFGF